MSKYIMTLDHSMSSYPSDNWQDTNYHSPLVVEYIWGPVAWPVKEEIRGRLTRRYFEFYDRERLDFNRKHNRLEEAIATHGQLAKLALSLFNNDREAARSTLEQSSRNTNAAERDATINLAARIISMVAIEGGKDEIFVGQSRLQWNEGEIQDLMKRQFEDQTFKEQQSRIRLERAFNARNVQKMVGFEISWTSNLADHLRFKEVGDFPVVNVFYFVGFLQISQSSTIYPQEFIEETMKTLSLLLPPGDKKTKNWWKSELKKKRDLDRCMMVGIELKTLTSEERRIQEFKFWKERLVILKEAFDEASPRTIPQWWHDNRKRASWFWVASALASMLFLLTVAQVVEGGLQVWLAMKAERDPAAVA